VTSAERIAWLDEVAGRLPPFPRVVLELLDRLRDEHAPLEPLARLARNDPAISAAVLAAANRMRRLRGMPDLRDTYAAAMHLGTDKLRAIIVGVGMNRFLDFGRAETFFFEHSLAVAVIAHELAQLAGEPPEVAYVAGILHDIGQLAFLVADGPAYREVLHLAAASGQLLVHEADTFGLDHSRAGALLAASWALPAEIVQAIEAHHESLMSGEQRLPALVNVAETLARGLDLPPSPTNRVGTTNAEALALLGLNWAMPEMTDCIGRCRARFRHAAG